MDLSFLKPIDREEWRKQRRYMISSGDAGTILGLNVYKTANVLLEEKLNGRKFETNEYIESGKLIEPFIAQYISEFFQSPILYDNALFADEANRTSAMPDIILENGKLIEIKATGAYNLTKWIQNGPNLNYLSQLHLQLKVTTIKSGYLCGFFFAEWPFTSETHKKISKLKKWTELKKVVDFDIGMWYVRGNDAVNKLLQQQIDIFWKKFEEGKKMPITKEVKETATMLISQTVTEMPNMNERATLSGIKTKVSDYDLSSLNQTIMTTMINRVGMGTQEEAEQTRDAVHKIYLELMDRFHYIGVKGYTIAFQNQLKAVTTYFEIHQPELTKDELYFIRLKDLIGRNLTVIFQTK